MNADNRIMVRVNTAKKDLFMKKAKEEGKSASEVLLELIDNYLGVSDKKDELEEFKQGLREELKKELGGEIALLRQQLLGESAA